MATEIWMVERVREALLAAQQGYTELVVRGAAQEEIGLAFTRVVSLSERYGVLLARDPARQLTAKLLESSAWEILARNVTVQAGGRTATVLVSRAGLSQFVSRLTYMFGIEEGLLSSGEIAAKAAAARGIAGKLLGWPMLLATVLCSAGCASSDLKDMAQSDEQAWELYLQYIVRFMRWCIGIYARKNGHVLPAPMTFEDFRANQNKIKLP